jgi:hypothetical protein
MADPFIGGYVCFYLARPATAELFYEDMIMQCVFFGVKILVETQKPGIMNYFRNRGYAPFLMILPGETEPGIASSPTSKQSAAYLVEHTIEEHINSIVFIEIIDDWLIFKIKTTQEHDPTMASLWTEVASYNKLYERKPDNKIVDITTIFKQYKVKSA